MALAYRPDAKEIVTGSSRGNLTFRDGSGNITSSFGVNNNVWSAQYSYDSAMVGVGVYDPNDVNGCVQIIDDKTKQVLMNKKEDLVDCIDAHPDNLQFVSGSQEGIVKIWDANNKKLLDTLKLTQQCRAIKYLSKNLLLIGTRDIENRWRNDGNIKIYDIEKKEFIHNFRIPCSHFHEGSFPYAFDSTGHSFIAALFNGLIMHGNINNKTLISCATEGGVYCYGDVNYNPTNKNEFVYPKGRLIKLFDLRKDKVSETILCDGVIQQAKYNPTNKKEIAVGGEDKNGEEYFEIIKLD